MNFVSVASLIGIALLVQGCGNAVVDLPKYQEFKNVQDAPEPLRKAARGIVKIIAYGKAYGTGAFLNSAGLLLTNNHVLGADGTSCAREGCHVEIHADFQLGMPPADPVEVFAEPLRVDPEADASVFQLWTDSNKARKFPSPHFLEVETVTSSALQGRRVHVIGHPHGNLKKWTSGDVYLERGTWFYSTNYSLPGNSGSPFLSDEGRIVGLNHRISRGNDLINRRNVMFYAIGTASAEIRKGLSSPDRRSLFYSIREAHSLEDTAKHHEAYLMAHAKEALLTDGRTLHPIDVLAERCDAALDMTDVSSPDRVSDELSYCSSAWSWLSCQDLMNIPGHKRCPNGADKDKWKKRFEKAAEISRRYNALGYLSWLLASARLESSPQVAHWTREAIFDSYIKKWKPRLTFDLAVDWLQIKGADKKYGELSAADFVKNYRSQPNYEYHYDAILTAHLKLYYGKYLSLEQYTAALRAMLDDEKLDVGSKLSLETTAYYLEILR